MWYSESSLNVRFRDHDFVGMSQMTNRLEEPREKLEEYFGEYVGQMLGVLNRGMAEPGYAGLSEVHEDVAEWMSAQWRKYLETLYANKLIDTLPDGFMVKRCADGSLYIQAMQIPKGFVMYGTKKSSTLKTNGVQGANGHHSMQNASLAQRSSMPSPVVETLAHQSIMQEVEATVEQMEQEVTPTLLPALETGDNLMAFVDREERTVPKGSLRTTAPLNPARIASSKVSTGLSPATSSASTESATDEAKPLRRRSLVRGENGELEAKD